MENAAFNLEFEEAAKLRDKNKKISTKKRTWVIINYKIMNNKFAKTFHQVFL